MVQREGKRLGEWIGVALPDERPRVEPCITPASCLRLGALMLTLTRKNCTVVSSSLRERSLRRDKEYATISSSLSSSTACMRLVTWWLDSR